MTQVAFASDAVTVHEKLGSAPDTTPRGDKVWAVTSRTLLAGQYVALSALPDYLRDAVRAGNVPNLEVLSEDKARERASWAAQQRAEVEAAEGVDSSHSAWVVPEEQLIEQHRGLGGESGAADTEEPEAETPVVDEEVPEVEEDDVPETPEVEVPTPDEDEATPEVVADGPEEGTGEVVEEVTDPSDADDAAPPATQEEGDQEEKPEAPATPAKATAAKKAPAQKKKP